MVLFNPDNNIGKIINPTSFLVSSDNAPRTRGHNTGSIFNQQPPVCPQDNTRNQTVNPVIMKDKVESAKAKFDKTTQAKSVKLNKQEMCAKLCQKWKKAFRNSPLQSSFFEKLYDVIDQLNVKVPESKWDKSKYSSPKEQAMDEVIAIFACEAQLNPRTVSSTKPPYYGLFQLANLKAVNQYAKEHPNEPGMQKIINNSKTMTMEKYRNLSGDDQLDYLIAYVGASRDGSNMKPGESITPAKLWSMIKFPCLSENIPAKKAKREKTIVQKENAIDSVFRANKVPRGLI